MFSAWNIECEGETLRGVIKHSWLEHQILATTSEQALRRSAAPGGWSAFEREFPIRLGQARDLAVRLLELFSPATLVEECMAFAKLDADAKNQLKVALHEAYLETSGIMTVREPLLVAVDQLETALDAFRSACPSGTRGNSVAAAHAWTLVLAAATQLATLLDRLPKGIVFP